MKTPLERAATLVEQQYKRNPEAVQLAKLASLAVRVESHLLRLLRLELLPDADVGIEADLWFAPLVESRGVRAIVLNRYVVELLRDKLAEDREQLQRVIVLTEQAHAESASTIRLEERLNALAVLNEPNVQQQIDEALRPALRTMQLGGDDARQLAQWAMRALPQAHRSVRESSNAIALGLTATLVLGGRPIVQEVPKLTGDLGDMTWLLRGAISGSPIRIGVELVAGGVAFAEPGGMQPQLDLPATSPLLLSLTWKAEGGDTTMLVEAAPGRTAELDADVTEVSLRTLNGDEYRLSAVSTVESSAETTSEDSGPRHFDNDVVISYARPDNEFLLEQKGWVTVFHETLSTQLSERMGREVKIWLGQDATSLDEWSNEIVAKFSKTAVMVSVVSPAYLTSKWCILEVSKFCEVAEETGGVMVDNRSRVFKVIKTPIDGELIERLPSVVRNTHGYEFFELHRDGGNYIDDLEAKIRAAIKVDRNDIATAYVDQLHQYFLKMGNDLADGIAQMLSRLSAEPQPQTPATKHARIFISYRRNDSAGYAGRVFDNLVQHFGEGRVLMDQNFLEGGKDFVRQIENTVDSCDILIAIIGKQWLSERLNTPDDMVRLEIARGLRRDIPVIPVLVQEAKMPWPEDLPGDLAKLIEFNAIELSDLHWQADLNRLISAIAEVLADPDEARRTLQSLEQRLALAREAGDRRGESIALGELGAAYADQGETRRAIEFFEQALRTHREMGDREDEGNMLRKLGTSYAELGETRHAIEFFEQALRIHREMGDRRMESNALHSLGAAYAELGEHSRAIEFFEQALRIHVYIGDRRGEGIALSSLGRLYAGLAESSRAIELFERAIVIDREMGDRTGEGDDLSSLSMALAQTGDHSKAIEYARMALTILEELDNPRAANVRAQLAALLDQTQA